jgi:transposase
MSDRFDHTLKHTLETKPGDGGEDAVTAVRRIELITGAGRRRQWSVDDKARIVVESLKPGTNVSEVARRNGLSPQQLFGWRREARAMMAEGADDASTPEQAAPKTPRAKSNRSRPSTGESSSAGLPAFASVVVASCAASSPPAPPTIGRIEIAIGDAVVRVIGQVDVPLIAAVLRAVRRAI